MSMTNGVAHGVEIYSLKLQAQIKRKLRENAEFAYLETTRFLSVYRILWNLFVLPFKSVNKTVYSFSTHGSLFIANQIITVHDLICFAYPAQHRAQYLYFKYFVPVLLRRCKKIIAISHFTKDEIIRHYRTAPEKITVITNGSNILAYSPNPTTENEFRELVQDKPYFLSVGASYPHKNIEALLNAALLLQHRIDCRFIIISKNNEYGHHLRRLAGELNLSNVVFKDFVSENLLAKLYQEAVANIYISLYEGFGFPPLEAASVGTVSLVSDIPVMREVLGANAFYVNSKDPVLLSQAILKLYGDPAKSNEIKNNFGMLLQQYSWERAAGQIINVINNG